VGRHKGARAGPLLLNQGAGFAELGDQLVLHALQLVETHEFQLRAVGLLGGLEALGDV
jgi:hypothetical protein